MMIELPEAVFQSYAFYAGILIVKMLFMSFLTAKHRIVKKSFANPEDLALSGKKGKIILDDPDVERVRRAHLNDLENILPFLICGLLYCFTLPDPGTATLVFQVFTAARIVHTIVYAVFVLPQPLRGLSWIVGQGCTIFMAVKVIMHFA